MTAADEETALALMDGLQQLWATGITAIRRVLEHPGDGGSAQARRSEHLINKLKAWRGTVVNRVQLLVLPPVTTKARGRPRPSQAK
ncbi:hypothetical protein OHA57_34370 [Streptomyces anulatus]|nr:hypothetical protein [Streptomyces anulatus]WSC66618.1 hypothetical protein OHA57_34370 [Streptomyces anulatus]